MIYINQFIAPLSTEFYMYTVPENLFKQETDGIEPINKVKINAKEITKILNY